MQINLIYFKDKSTNGNFGDELSKFITTQLLNKKYKLTFNLPNAQTNLLCIGSYIHMAKNNSHIFGSGVRTKNNQENGHKYSNLIVHATRGPLTQQFLQKKGIKCPNVYGDPALLLPKFYKPQHIPNLSNKIAILPHKSHFHKYSNFNQKNYFIINPTDKWQTVINQITSCKSVISSSLHGLICADAYNKPNIMYDPYPLDEGDFKFYDYFLSQNRPFIKINKLNEFKEELLYTKGNTLNLNQLINAFPFQ